MLWKGGLGGRHHLIGAAWPGVAIEPPDYEEVVALDVQVKLVTAIPIWVQCFGGLKEPRYPGSFAGAVAYRAWKAAMSPEPLKEVLPSFIGVQPASYEEGVLRAAVAEDEGVPTWLEGGLAKDLTGEAVERDLQGRDWGDERRAVNGNG